MVVSSAHVQTLSQRPPLTPPPFPGLFLADDVVTGRHIFVRLSSESCGRCDAPAAERGQGRHMQSTAGAIHARVRTIRGHARSCPDLRSHCWFGTLPQQIAPPRCNTEQGQGNPRSASFLPETVRTIPLHGPPRHHPNTLGHQQFSHLSVCNAPTSAAELCWTAFAFTFAFSPAAAGTRAAPFPPHTLPSRLRSCLRRSGRLEDAEGWLAGQ